MNMKHMVDGYMVSNPGAARPKIAQGKSEGSRGDLKWDSKKVFFFLFFAPLKLFSMW